MAQEAAIRAAEPLLAASRTCKTVDALTSQLHQRLAAVQLEAAAFTTAQHLPPKPPTILQNKMVDLEIKSGHQMRRNPKKPAMAVCALRQRPS